MKTRAGRKTIPDFKSEAEEAAWWFKNRKALDVDFAKAARTGTLRVLDRKTLLSRIAGAKAKTTSLRVPEADLRRAREQAAARGLPYQTYIKSLLHQALDQAPKP